VTAGCLVFQLYGCQARCMPVSYMPVSFIHELVCASACSWPNQSAGSNLQPKQVGSHTACLVKGPPAPSSVSARQAHACATSCQPAPCGVSSTASLQNKTLQNMSGICIKGLVRRSAVPRQVHSVAGAGHSVVRR